MKNKNIFIIFLLLLIILGISFRIASLNKDFSGEEPDFVNPIEALKNTGHPVFYHSEQQPVEIALWHPPMYIFLVSNIIKIIPNEIGIRFLNAALSIFVSLFIFLFCYKFLGYEQDKINKKGFIVGLLAASFFLINYFVFSSSIMIDIDILSSFFVFGFVFFIANFLKNGGKYNLIFSMLFLLFGLFNRYPMMILSYFFIGLYFIFKKDLRKNLKNYILVGFFGFAIFLILWGGYSIFIEPGNFFSFISHNVKFGSSQFSDSSIYLSSFILNIAQFTRLLTLPATILAVISLFYFVKRRTKETDLILMHVLPILIFFIILPRPAFGYPRYFMTILPGIFVLISLMVYNELNEIKFTKEIAFFIGFIFVLSFILLTILNPQGTFYSGEGLIKATNLPDFILNIFCSIPLIFVLFFKENKKKILLIILLSLLLSYSLYFDIKLVANDSYSKEAGEYLKEKLSPEDIIIAPKAVGYYAGTRIFINDNNKPDLNFSYNHLKEYFIRSYKDREMKDSFFWSDGIYSGLYPTPIPNQENIKKAKYVVKYSQVKGYEPEKIIGPFYIYNLES